MQKTYLALFVALLVTFVLNGPELAKAHEGSDKGAHHKIHIRKHLPKRHIPTATRHQSHPVNQNHGGNVNHNNHSDHVEVVVPHVDPHQDH